MHTAPQAPVGATVALHAHRRRRRRRALGLALGLAVLMAIPVLHAPEAEARRGGGFSRSFGRRSFRSTRPSRPMRAARPARPSSTGSGARRTWGSASGGYQRKGGLFGQRSKRGSAFSRSQRPTTAGRRLTHNARGQRMLPRTQATTTRATRASSFQRRYRQPTYRMNPTFYGGRPWGGWGYGAYSVGIWDVFFLSTVSHMFWYHHWHDPSLQQALRKDNLMQKEELARLEARVKELEAKGVPRDPNYLPPEVDPDLAYSKEYVEKHQTEFYSEPAATPEIAQPAEDSEGSWPWLAVLFGLFGVGVLVYAVFVRRY